MLLMKLQVKQIRRGKNIRIMNLKDLLLQMTISEKRVNKIIYFSCSAVIEEREEVFFSD